MKNKKKEDKRKKYPNNSPMFIAGLIIMLASLFIPMGTDINKQLRFDISAIGMLIAIILTIPAIWNMVVKMDKDEDEGYTLYLGKLIALPVLAIAMLIYLIRRLIEVLGVK